MSQIGNRIINDFKRPDKKLWSEISNIPVPNLDDTMNRMMSLPSYFKKFSGQTALGPAYTVKLPAGDNLLLYYAIDHAKPGDILVISNEGFTERALCGEIMIGLAQKRGLGGLIIDGAIRDKEELKQLDIAVFAKASNPNGPYKNGPGEINTPIAIGNQVIFPGDIIYGDEDGIIVIPKDHISSVIEESKQIIIKESKMLSSIAETSSLDLNWVDEKIKSIDTKFI